MILLLSLLALLFGCQHHESEVKGDKLYILHSEKGIFTRNSVQKSLGKLVMNDVTDEVAYFSPTPSRKAGSLNLAQFLALWQKEQSRLKQAPASAGFIFYDKDGKEYDHEAIRLVLPSYDPKLNSLTIVIEAINDDFAFEKKEMKEVTLFLNLNL